MQVGPIICAVCNKPVDSWSIHRREDLFSTEMVVRCHGDKDTMRVGPNDLRDPGAAKALEDAVARGGVAFRNQRIEDDQTQQS